MRYTLRNLGVSSSSAILFSMRKSNNRKQINKEIDYIEAAAEIERQKKIKDLMKEYNVKTPEELTAVLSQKYNTSMKL